MQHLRYQPELCPHLQKLTMKHPLSDHSWPASGASQLLVISCDTDALHAVSGSTISNRDNTPPLTSATYVDTVDSAPAKPVRIAYMTIVAQ
jgi:hypothetical protein